MNLANGHIGHRRRRSGGSAVSDGPGKERGCREPIVCPQRQAVILATMGASLSSFMVTFALTQSHPIQRTTARVGGKHAYTDYCGSAADVAYTHEGGPQLFDPAAPLPASPLTLALPAVNDPSASHSFVMPGISSGTMQSVDSFDTDLFPRLDVARCLRPALSSPTLSGIYDRFTALRSALRTTLVAATFLITAQLPAGSSAGLPLIHSSNLGFVGSVLITLLARRRAVPRPRTSSLMLHFEYRRWLAFMICSIFKTTSSAPFSKLRYSSPFEAPLNAIARGSSSCL
ncbi:hypothetical protein R3P38DRAFT_3164503 [Favolaschia claudopus]|uniref:Uncharacterized protein n=1 Tax=Favolaschia claudopus TaxID=2862362 RepID=A0AAW0EFA2_9AGAR